MWAKVTIRAAVEYTTALYVDGLDDPSITERVTNLAKMENGDNYDKFKVLAINKQPIVEPVSKESN